MNNTEPLHLSQTKRLTPLHNKPHRMMEMLISVLGSRDYYKQIHFHGSYVEVWLVVKHGDLAIYKVAFVDYSKDGAYTTTHGTVWDIANKYYPVSYGYNGLYETSSNNSVLQKQHSDLFTMLMNDVRTMFFPEFTAIHPKRSHAQKEN